MEGNINDFKGLLYLIAIILVFLFKKKYPILKNDIKLILPILILVFFHSLFFSFKPLWSLWEFFKWLLIFILIFVVKSRFSSKRILNFISYYFVAKGIYLIVTSNVIFLLGYNIFYSDNGDFHGLLTNANMFGYSIVLSFPFIQTIIKKKLIIRIFIVNALFLIIASASRGALLCFIIYLFFNINQTYKLQHYFLLVLLLIPIIFFYGDTSFLFKSGSNDIEGVFSTRSHFWLARLEAIESKPYLGWGYSVNEFTYFSKYIETNLREKGNTILALIEEYGIFFGSVLVFFLIKIFKKASSGFIISGNQKIAFFLWIILINSLFETWLFNFNSVNTILVWFVVFIGFSYKNKNLYAT